MKIIFVFSYPTVARGEELLCVAPTPYHTKQMMNHFVNAVISVFLDNGIQLSTAKKIECDNCHRPMKFEAFLNLDLPPCNGILCNNFLLKAAA